MSSNLDQRIGVKREVKPFNSDSDKQLQYIKTIEHLRWNGLTRDDFSPIFQVLKKNKLVSNERINLLIDAVWRRLEYVRRVLNAI